MDKPMRRIDLTSSQKGSEDMRYPLYFGRIYTFTRAGLTRHTKEQIRIFTDPSITGARNKRSRAIHKD